MRLIIMTGQTPLDPLHYVQAEGGKLSGGGMAADLNALAEKLDGTPSTITVLLPGESLAIRRLNNPARNNAQLLRAARFLLEDELAGPVDDMHVALGGAEQEAGRPVIAADRAWIAGWIEALKEAGLSPDVLSADVLALGIAGQGVMLLEKNRLTLNILGEGFVGERPLADDLATALIAASELERVGIIRVADAAPLAMPEGVAPQEITLPQARNIPAFFAGHMEDNAPPNLLQGEFEPGLDWQEMLGPWKYAGGLAAACAALWLVVIGIEGAALHRNADQLDARATSEFTAAYPDLPRRNITSQARRLAAETGNGETHFLGLSSILANALEQRDGMQLAGLTYDPENQLVADIRFSDTGELEALKQALAGYGIAVEEGRNLSRDNNAYIGKLYLRTS